MSRKTGYLANVFNVPPLVFRFQYNPDILVEKKGFRYEQAANFGRYALDRMEAGGVAGALGGLSGLYDDIKEIGSLLTATRPLEAVEGEPRTFEIDFALDAQGGGDGSDQRPSIIDDLEILRSFMNPGFDGLSAIQDAIRRTLPCYQKPPECTLKYGGISVTGAMTNLSIKMVRFADNGDPTRAEVTVSLKEQTYGVGPVVEWALRQVHVARNMGRSGYLEDLLYASPVGGIAAALSEGSTGQISGPGGS